MSDINYEQNRQTVIKVEEYLLRNFNAKPSAVVLSANRKNAFVRIGETWQRMDLSEYWTPGGPVPGYIPAANIEAFYEWVEKARDREHRAGRRVGENAMRAAIRRLIGAADLVDLEQREDSW
jgi:hypothetical protein